jgi:hypothetical protein
MKTAGAVITTDSPWGYGNVMQLENVSNSYHLPTIKGPGDMIPKRDRFLQGPG